MTIARVEANYLITTVRLSFRAALIDFVRGSFRLHQSFSRDAVRSKVHTIQPRPLDIAHKSDPDRAKEFDAKNDVQRPEDSLQKFASWGLRNLPGHGAYKCEQRRKSAGRCASQAASMNWLDLVSVPPGRSMPVARALAPFTPDWE